MRKFLLAAVAAAAIASPAAARDGSGYVGVDLGAMLAEDTKLDFDNGVTQINNAISPDYNTGWDIGLVGGYDFGLIRGELDLSYKHAGVNEVVLGDIGGLLCNSPDDCIRDADGDASVLSVMGNLLLDFGDNDGVSGYVGAGVGMSRVDIDTDFSGTFPTIPVTGFGVDDDDSSVAWQLIAGFRFPVSDNIDAGVKYRFHNTRKLTFQDTGDTDRLEGHWRSHSLLASFTYNFYSPPPPPPPPPAAASAASGDADVPGRIGDPGDRGMPGSAASASAAAAGARARLNNRRKKKAGPGKPGPAFSMP